MDLFFYGLGLGLVIMSGIAKDDYGYIWGCILLCVGLVIMYAKIEIKERKKRIARRRLMEEMKEARCERNSTHKGNKTI